MDRTLNPMSKLARDFLWDNHGNGSGIHLVGWSVTTLNKFEGAVGIRNLKLARTTLTAKNTMSFLNSKEVAWVELTKLKYGSLKAEFLIHCPNFS